MRVMLANWQKTVAAAVIGAKLLSPGFPRLTARFDSHLSLERPSGGIGQVHSSARARGLRFDQLQRRALAPADALEDPINGEHAALEVDILPAPQSSASPIRSPSDNATV